MYYKLLWYNQAFKMTWRLGCNWVEKHVCSLNEALDFITSPHTYYGNIKLTVLIVFKYTVTLDVIICTTSLCKHLQKFWMVLRQDLAICPSQVWNWQQFSTSACQVLLAFQESGTILVFWEIFLGVFILLYVYGCFTCMYVYHVCTWCT